LEELAQLAKRLARRTVEKVPAERVERGALLPGLT
jgi:hypothetical protein